ncbi:MAG: VCBS repeat-containing protein [Acidobacteriota bacterium]
MKRFKFAVRFTVTMVMGLQAGLALAHPGHSHVWVVALPPCELTNSCGGPPGCDSGGGQCQNQESAHRDWMVLDHSIPGKQKLSELWRWANGTAPAGSRVRAVEDVPDLGGFLYVLDRRLTVVSPWTGASRSDRVYTSSEVATRLQDLDIDTSSAPVVLRVMSRDGAIYRVNATDLALTLESAGGWTQDAFRFVVYNNDDAFALAKDGAGLVRLFRRAATAWYPVGTPINDEVVAFGRTAGSSMALVTKGGMVAQIDRSGELFSRITVTATTDITGGQVAVEDTPARTLVYVTVDDGSMIAVDLETEAQRVVLQDSRLVGAVAIAGMWQPQRAEGIHVIGSPDRGPGNTTPAEMVFADKDGLPLPNLGRMRVLDGTVTNAGLSVDTGRTGAEYDYCFFCPQLVWGVYDPDFDYTGDQSVHVASFILPRTTTGELDEVEKYIAYNARGGVTISVGNVDPSLVGDFDFDEIVTGPGPGPQYGPHVRAIGFDLATQNFDKQYASFFGYGTLKFGVNVATGDVDGDGMDEIITGAGPGKVFGPHVRVFKRAGSNRWAPLPGASFFAFGTLEGGANVAAGDLDGDGDAEIVASPGPRPTFAEQVRAFDWSAGRTTPRPENYIFDTFTFGGFPAVGDLDGDGRAEISAAAGPSTDHRGLVTSIDPATMKTLTFEPFTNNLMFGSRPRIAELGGE